MRVPIGVAGELFIGGDGLAIGYHHRPELTSERFVVASLDGESGARLYRTGDLVRHLADGRVTHLGRLDSQVKIRGFRIELGEIESVLAEHPSVVRAVVDVRSDSLGAKTLVGYCQTRDGALPDAHELREALRRSLPDYMVPTHFVLLDHVPLTPNGKVDRSALPDPDHAQRLVATAAVAPRTPVEQQLVQIWTELLGVEHIGIRDDFFDLGGHSLLALQMLARITEAFGVDMPLQRLFEATTIEAVAALVEAGGDLPDESSEIDRYLPALAEIWCEVLAVSEVGSDGDFFALGGDSSMLNEMLVRTRRSLGVLAEGLSEVEFRRTPTVRGLAALVARNAQRATSLIVPLRREGQGPPLFLIHAGGGYAFFYRALASQFEGRPLYAIRAESRSDGWGRPFVEESDFESVAARYLAEVQALQPEGPYLLGGACAGGLIAFEMARQLESRGLELAGPVIVFDSILSNNDRVSAADRGILQAAGIYPMPRLQDLRRAFSRRLDEAHELGLLPGVAHISRAASRRALRALRRRMVRLAGRIGLDLPLGGVARTDTIGTTPAPDDGLRSEMAEILEVAIRCSFAYRPQPVDVAVLCFEAAETGPLGLSWQGVAKRGLVVIETPGSHLDMLEHPWVEQTAADIDEYLLAAL
jgi:thioesterase domain-containing protein/acyl carrier protein